MPRKGEQPFRGLSFCRALCSRGYHGGGIVSRKAWCRRTLVLALLAWTTFAIAEVSQQQKLERQFQSAVAQYDAGQYPEAAAQLEQLLPHVPNNFEVEELTGLVYASMFQDAKAIVHLKAAVRLEPTLAAARTNLAASLSRMGDAQAAGEQLRKAFELAPHDYTTNHNLGEFYIKSGRIPEALPLLKQAQALEPSAYDNGYDLAMADLVTGHLSEARQLVQGLIQKKDTGELHNLLAQIEEKDGKFVAAVNEFETAAHMDPSEDNLFDWGSELLLHRTYEPAIEVFRAASSHYPKSPRLMIGLGMALYARGFYEDAVKALLTAADLNPSDPRCYLFLSKAYESSPTQVDEVIQRFKRYATLEPNNALAQYYYAMSLWKGKQAAGSGLNFEEVESLLKKSIALDGSIAEAHMQLGNLYADQRHFERSIPEYVRALELNPNLSDAHYRLGTDYVHTGQKDRAQAEFAIYQKLRAQHMAEIDKERAEVQLFIYSSKGAPAAKP
jgi:tetratricopeptide (TPR) repeat protein